MRAKVERQYSEQMAGFVQRAETPAALIEGGDGGADDLSESISLVASTSSQPKAAAERPVALLARDNLYAFAMLHVLLRHNVDLWAPSSGAANPLASLVHDVLAPIALPTFLLFAGMRHLHGPPRPATAMARQVATFLAAGLLFFYVVPRVSLDAWSAILSVEAASYGLDEQHTSQMLGAKLHVAHIFSRSAQWYAAAPASSAARS